LRQQLGVSRETLKRLDIYHQLLLRWQQKTISSSTLADFWTRHIADSLQCIAIMPDKYQWTDIGAGAGFPGLVLAIVLADKQEANVRLIESNNKKCAFLRTVIRETGACAEVFPVRAENFIKTNNSTEEMVCARAVMSLDELFELCEPWLGNRSTGLFHKGRNYCRELEETHDKWRFDLIEHKSAVNQDSVVLEVSGLQRRS